MLLGLGALHRALAVLLRFFVGRDAGQRLGVLGSAVFGVDLVAGVASSVRMVSLLPFIWAMPPSMKYVAALPAREVDAERRRRRA